MKISPNWLRDFVDLKVNERQLAEDLTMHGVAVEGITGAGVDTVFEVEFTPNRPDAMNHYGVARECSAIYDVDLKPLNAKLPAAAMAARAGVDFDPQPDKNKDRPHSFPIIIEDTIGCARYTGRIVRGVTVKESPAWMVSRLESVEQRSISNAADATNYVLWEIGHPTHVFDLDLLEGKIIVRRAREGESLRTLDGVERKLTKDDLVIADAHKPVALAGVMGGFDTMITQRTRNILIEAAWFDPVTIRKTARRHSLHTDASHRFERGADWAATPLACARVAQLILESAGGHIEGAAIDTVGCEITRPVITLRAREVQRILGKEIAAAEVERILRRLGFAVKPGTKVALASSPAVPSASLLSASEEASGASAPAPHTDAVTVQPPTWRLDVEREIDVIEEIARLHGYENFPNTLPAFAGAVVERPDEQKDRKVRQRLLALGYDEAVSWTFIATAEAQAFSSVQPLALENPISDEAAVMRTSLAPGMVHMLGWNLNRGNNDVRLFEAGHVFEKIGEHAGEHPRISMGATGDVQASRWDEKARAYTLFDMKGDIEQLLALFEHRSLYFDEHAGEFLHAGRSARAVMDGATVARFGQLHPEIAAARKLRQDVYVGEIYLDRLYQHALREPHYTATSRYPAVDRDFSFLFDNAVTFGRIRTAVEALKIGELRSFTPVEIFRGGGVLRPGAPSAGAPGVPPLAASKYSVLLRAEFQSAQRTLTDEEAGVWARQIIKALESLGGKLRA